MDIILVIACLYFAYSSITLLMEVPFAEWEVVQYVLAAITVGLLVAGIMRGWKIIKRWKNGPPPEEKKESATVIYDDDDDGDEEDELAYLDEMDAMEDAAAEKEKAAAEEDAAPMEEGEEP